MTIEVDVLPPILEALKARERFIFVQGGIGCIHKDTLIDTIDGKRKASDIASPTYYLSFDDKINKFKYVLGTAPFPKGKGLLYRVKTKTSEFVAYGLHLIFCADYKYRSLEQIYLSENKAFYNLAPTIAEHDLLKFQQDALRLMKKREDSQSDYQLYNRLSDQQLQSFLDTDLCAFQQLGDALKSSLFFCFHIREHLGVQQAQGLKHSHHAELLSLLSKMDFYGQSEHELEALAGQVVSSFFESTLQADQLTQQSLASWFFHHTNQLRSEYQSQNTFSYDSPLLTATYTENRILSIEPIGEDVYYDLHVPVTNNYVAHGVIHHNSGKSFGIGDKLVQYRSESKHNKCLLGANTYSQLRDSTVEAVTESLMRYGFFEDEHYDLNWSKKMLDFQGMRVYLRSFENDVNKSIAGMTLHKILLDEFAFFGKPSQTGKYIYNKLLGRMRGAKEIGGDELTHQFAAFSSPNGYNHCYDIWVENATDQHKLIQCVTKDNIYLPEGFYESLVAAYGGEASKLARQELFGEFIDLVSGRPYWGYDKEKCFLKDQRYRYKLQYPIDICHDFNIGSGKPMSLAVGQYYGGTFHVAKTICIESMRTGQIMEELASYGLFELKARFRVFGDASGKNRDTRNNKNDYDIIKKFLANYNTKENDYLDFEFHVPRANPRIRTRHNIANATMENGKLKIYKDAKTANDGFLKTKFLKSSNLIEDDSLFEQHVTTAITYWIHYIKITMGASIGSKTYK